MNTLIQDARYALRTLAKQPSYAAVSIVIIALAIGANTIIFSFANVFVLRPLPIADADEMAWIWSTNARRNVDRGWLSVPDYIDLRNAQTTCDSLAAFMSGGHTMTGRGEARRLAAMRVTANLLAAWRLQPLLGRGFSEGDDRVGTPHTVLLSHRYWIAMFGADPSVVGSRLTLDGEPYTVIGVLGPDIEIGNLSTIDVWTPLTLDSSLPRDQRSLRVTGRRKAGATTSSVNAEVAGIARSLEAAYPRTNAGWSARAVPTSVGITGPHTWTLLTLLGLTVALILAIACANLANLMLARGAARRREIAVRAALGAGRGRIVRQLVSESLVIGIAGGSAGIGLALASLRAMRAASPDPLYRWVSVDVRVVAFAAILSVLTALLFSSIPALQASRTNLNDILRGGARGSEDRRGYLGRATLVVSQLTLALALMIVAGLTVRTMIAMARTPLGFETRDLLAMRVELPEWKYRSESDRERFWNALLPDLRAVPGVSVAGATSNLPVIDAGASVPIDIEGHPVERDEDRPWASSATISDEYFRCVGIPLVAGRAFTTADANDAPSVAIVNDEMVKRYWRTGENAVGGRIRSASGRGAGRWLTIVGVSASVKRADLRGADPQFYVPVAQFPERTLTMLIRGESVTGVAASVRDRIRSADIDVPVDQPRTVDQILEDDWSSTRVLIGLFVSFGILALTMGAAGLYGVMSYLVSCRTKEFGIRLALGASPSQIRSMVGRQSARLVAIGTTLGLLIGAALSRLTLSLLYEVSPFDPVTFFGGTIVLLAVAAFASLWPIRRATRVEAIVALRTD